MQGGHFDVRNTILLAVLGCALVAGAVIFLVTGGTEAQDPAEEQPAPAAEEEDGAPAEPPEAPANPPAGETADKGLVFKVPYERGEGELVFARQNGLLRVDMDVRIPYHGGAADGRDRGSSVSLALSVDGRNGRYLTFYPAPLWLPSADGSLPPFRTESIYGVSDGVRRSGEEAGFGAVAEIGEWDRFRTTFFIDTRRVLLPGNTPGSPSDEWLVGLAVGSEAGAAVFPAQLDPANPAKSAKHLIAIKLSELPKIADADEDPRKSAIENEKATHDAMRAVLARMVARDMPGAFKLVLEAREAHKEQLWPFHLAYLISSQTRNVEGIDNDYIPYLKTYLDAAPSQSRAHFEYIDALIAEQQEEAAFTHFKTLSESSLARGRKESAAYMNLEWCNRIIPLGYDAKAAEILNQLEEDETIAGDDSLRLNLKFARATLAERQGNSAKAAAIYAEIVTKERNQLNQQQIATVQQRQQFQLQAVEQWEQELKYREQDAEKKNPRWIIETEKGRIVVELFEDDAPNTVASLVSLAGKEFYDGLTFHRVIGDFMAQGGCPNADGTGGPGYRTKFEENERKHFRGTVAMARSQSKDSQGSQFYICHANSPNVLNLSGGYLVVGRVIEGMDVVDKLRIGTKINTIRAENLRDHEYKPEVIED